MRQLAALILCGLILFVLPGCMTKSKKSRSGLGFKRVTPEMAVQMERLMELGCDEEFEYFDRDIAMLYSVFPGGGQFYLGETRKAFMYMLSSPFILPYIVSFQDAQNSVDYYNFKYTIHFCKKLLKVTKKAKPQSKDIVIGGPED